jgi:hypothetical protein
MAGSPSDMVQLFELSALLTASVPLHDQPAQLEGLIGPVLKAIFDLLADPNAQVHATRDYL